MIFNKFKKVIQKPDGRVFAIGDVHGCLNKLHKLLQLVSFDTAKDHIVFVGDLADRGEQSLDTFDFVLDKPYFSVVAGNHEHMFYEYVLGSRALPKDLLDYWISDDGKWILNESKSRLEVLANKLHEQCFIIVEAHTLAGKHFGITHASYDQDRWYDPSADYPDDYFGRMMWSRQSAESPQNSLRPVQGIDFTVHGHTIFQIPRKNGNALFIDTGCFAGGTLTALDLTSLAISEQFDQHCIFSI